MEPLDGFAARHARTTTRASPRPTSPSAWPWVVKPAPGWRRRPRCPPARIPLLRRVKQAGARSLAQPAIRRHRRLGLVQRAEVTAPSSSTSRPVKSSTSCPIATPRPLSTWLAAHPGIELVSRDRASAYSQAATEAASQTQQVADRWHLLKNVREAIERLLDRHLPVITDALKPAEPDPKPVDALPGGEPEAATIIEPTPPESPSPPVPVSPRQEAARAKRQRRVERFERVHELRRQGMPIRQIARELAMTRKAVRRYLNREQCPDWRPGRATHSGMDAHREWIDGRIAEGRINASELHRELASRGVRLSYATVRRSLTKRLGRAGQTRPRVNAAKPKPTPPPSAKHLSFDWIRRPEKRTAEAQGRLDKIRAASPELTMALDLADEFTALIRKQSTGTLADWLSRAEVSACPEVRHFAEGIRRDESAVNAAVTLHWSNGPVEGHVNRLKTIKRQMYGRAGFALLKARVVSVE